MAYRKQEDREAPVKNNENPVQADQLTVTYYTDPLCCWSWGFAAQWRRFLAEWPAAMRVRYVMGVMIPDWEHYHDPLNCVSRALQMGPLWMQAAEVTHTPIDSLIWHVDPPRSSYPPCLAVKTAALQSALAEEKYLYKVQEAVMTRRLNISKTAVLLALSEELAGEMPGFFDADRFKADWKSGNGKLLLRKDRQDAMLHKVGRYPTLTVTDNTGEGIMLVGYRPYGALLEAFSVMGTVKR